MGLLNEDRLLPTDPAVRGLARDLYESVRALPIISLLENTLADMMEEGMVLDAEIAQNEAQRAAMADAYIEQFKEAKARGDDDAMFRAAQALGGQHFVDYVLESHSFLIADIENAIRLSNERAAIRAKLEARLNQPTDGYKPQSGWSTYYEQAVDRSEQSYRRNLQHYLRGGNPSDPRVYNLYD